MCINSVLAGSVMQQNIMMIYYYIIKHALISKIVLGGTVYYTLIQYVLYNAALCQHYLLILRWGNCITGLCDMCGLIKH